MSKDSGGEGEQAVGLGLVIGVPAGVVTGTICVMFGAA